MTFRIVALGDSAVLVEFDERIDIRINERVVRMAQSIEAAELAGVRDVVPTFRSVAVYFDPLRTDYNTLTELLEREAGRTEGPARGPAKTGAHRTETVLRIPVCYGGDFGPDLYGVAAHAGLTESEVIARHAAPVYRVFMMGFLPGFTYLGPVDDTIVVPRHATPRVRVPAGSVGIAGRQTGIYPSETPGGWQLVGRTPVRIFDAARSDPFLLKPGDSVKFYSIDPAEYARARSS
jgi:KipI family sensor histidine kinase inhibitor